MSGQRSRVSILVTQGGGAKFIRSFAGVEDLAFQSLLFRKGGLNAHLREPPAFPHKFQSLLFRKGGLNDPSLGAGESND